MTFKDQIREAVTDVLREQVPDVTILSINIRNDEVSENTLIVNVVFETAEKFDPKKFATIPADVLAKLDVDDDAPFPILSFIAKSDLGKKKPEAA